MKITFNKTFSNYLQHAFLRWGSGVLFIGAFIDSSVFLFPVTTLFIVFMVIGNARPVKYLISVTLGTIAGALAGYAIGHYTLTYGDDRFTAIVQNIMDHNPGFSDLLYYKLRVLLNKWGLLELVSAFLSPIPYGMFSITAGLCNLNLITFMITSIACALLKFSFLGVLIIRIVERIKIVSDPHRTPCLDTSLEIRYREIG